MKNNLCCLLISVVLFSCTKTIDLDDQDLANQVIVNSIIWPDQPFSVYLTRSSSILKNHTNYPPMEGALDLYEDEILIRQFPTQPGKFSATDINPKSGKKYRIMVTSNGKAIHAETTIPLPAEVKGIDTVTINNQNGYKTTNYSIVLQDKTGDDYYRIVVTNETLIQSIDPNDARRMKYYLNKSQQYISSDDTIVKTLNQSFDGTFHGQGRPETHYLMFPDTYFQGEEINIRFNCTTYFNGNTDSNSDAGTDNRILKRICERNVVHVQQLSKELYTYLKYLVLYNNFYSNPLSEPITVYSNVKYGAGIFAGFNDDARFTFETIYIPFLMDTIHLEEYPSYGNQ